MIRIVANLLKTDVCRKYFSVYLGGELQRAEASTIEKVRGTEL